MTGGEFYWCLKHGRVEHGAETCPGDDRLGPYPSEAAARNWKQTVEARNDRWDQEDREWAGDDDD